MAWLWIGLSLAALAACLGLWVLGAPWAAARDAARTRPPALWWPWVLALAPWCEPFVTWRMRRELRRWGPRAGLAAHWQADRGLRGGLRAGGRLWGCAGRGGGLVATAPPRIGICRRWRAPCWVLSEPIRSCAAAPPPGEYG